MTAPRIVTDPMDPARALALAATLNRDWSPEAPLPPFAHQIYFWEMLPEAELGRDGHPARGGFLPDTGLPRRMWAGGRLEFHAPLHAGRPAEKTSLVESVTEKTGRSGRLVFITVRHELRQEGRLCVTEWQEIVNRADPAPGTPAPVPPDAAATPEAVAPRRYSATTLFRYSALTFNGHRIHYDADYCREVEGYPGLVVHGPLLAQELMLFAPGPLRRFSYRATATLFAGEAARLCRAGPMLWVEGPGGRLCMSAETA